MTSSAHGNSDSCLHCRTHRAPDSSQKVLMGELSYAALMGTSRSHGGTISFSYGSQIVPVAVLTALKFFDALMWRADLFVFET